jgi:CHAT domain-containing protein/tetratricopeptide (TPR) repeat protein
MPATTPALPSRGPRRAAAFLAPTASIRIALRVAAIASLCQLFTRHASPSRAAPGLLGELAELLDHAPPVAPRLSISGESRPCWLPVDDGAAIAAPVCRPPAAGSRAALRILAIGNRARAAMAGPSAADALHTLGLLDLLWADGSGKSLARAISSLQGAARLSERPAPALADLSAAYLVRAERMHTPRDLLEAVEAARRALAADPSNVAARYDLAMALELDGMDHRAALAWEAYLRVDGASEWASQAALRVRAPAPRPIAAAPRGVQDSLAVAEFAAREPAQAQLLAWDDVLGTWGEAVMGKDWARADERLRFAAMLGSALERRGLDRGVADQVREIRRQARLPAALGRLARAHRDYARGRRGYEAGGYQEAGSAFARARAAARPGSPLHQWATLFYGATVMFRTSQGGEPILRRAALDADTARHPALAGRARWLLGTSLLRQGRYPQASAAYGAAVALLRRAGEREHVGAVQGFAGTAQHHLGNAADAYASLHAAVLSLRPYRRSLWPHGALWAQADAAAGDGYLYATAEILDEDVAVTAAAGDPVNAAEARTNRARVMAWMGAAEPARDELRAGLADALKQVGPEQARSWFGADLLEAEAAVAAHDDPARAKVLLDSAVDFWTTGHNVLRLLPPLIARADVLLRLGRVAEARSDLGRVVAALGAGRGSIAASAERNTVLDSVRAVTGRIALLRIAHGRPGAALREVEAARAALLPPAIARPWGGGERIAAPRGQTALVYALVGDTLLTWTVRGTVLRVSRTPVDARALAAAAERAGTLLERAPGATGAPAEAALRALYDALIRPVERLLPPDGAPLLIVPDPAFESVPFAALRGGRTARYLAAAHPLRVAATLRGPAARSSGRTGAPALLVAATEFDRHAFPELERLPGVVAEVRALEHGYPDANVLAGPGATRGALLAALPHAGVVHFAGHALFDDQHPERSRLLLAPASDPGEPAGLTAGEVERLRLPHLGVVVLSACETLRSPSGRSGGFAGLAGAFLSAGATGVVGSLWRVDDEATRALMTAFHEAYRRDGDGAGALRSAQLQMLRSGDPRLQSPAAWAGFRYVGR